MLRRLLLPGVLAGLAACTPAWEWRSLTLTGTPLAASFPCKPDVHARDVAVGARRLRLTLHACTDHDTVFAIGWAPVAEPADVGPVLGDLRAAAAANLGVVPTPVQPFVFPGATPNAQAGRQALAGKSPDGRPVQAHVAVFAVGTTAFQATVVGAAPDGEAVSHFLGALSAAGAAPGAAR